MELRKVPYQPPIVSYGGRKGNMMKNIIRLMNRYNINCDKFIDVFGGSGIVGLTVKYNSKFPTVIINDFDRRISAVHKCGELQIFKSEVAEILQDKITKYFYSAVNQGYFLKFLNMFKYRSADLPDVATVSILRSIFNFRGKWKTNDNPIEGLYGQYPPIQPNIWKIPTLLKEMSSGKTDELYSGISSTNLDYKLLVEAQCKDALFYLDPPYIDNTTVYRKGSGILAIDSLELMANSDVPFIYSHDKVPVIVELAKKYNLDIEKFNNLSRSGTVKTELLIHNLDRYFERSNPDILRWCVDNLSKVNNKQEIIAEVVK